MMALRPTPAPMTLCRIGEEVELCASASDALVCVLRGLHLAGGDRFLAELSTKIRGTRRHHLARVRAEVYPFERSWDHHVREVVPGWFIGVNCNNGQKDQWVAAACALLGKSYGRRGEVYVDWARPLPDGTDRSSLAGLFWHPGA